MAAEVKESLLCRFTDLDKDIAIIALPALASLAADPIASLVDTAYIGKLGETFFRNLSQRIDLKISQHSPHVS